MVDVRVPKHIKLELDGEAEYFEIKLLDKAFVTDFTKDKRSHYIFLYKLAYRKADGQTITSTIPYYLSDGHSNHFNGAVLLPFACINSSDSNACPTNPDKMNGLLFKYNPVDNFKTGLIHNQISTDLEAYFKRVASTRNYSEADIQKLMEWYQTDRDQYITSFLGRLKNFFDFFIGIVCNYKLANDLVEQHYIPNYTDRGIAKYNFTNPIDGNLGNFYEYHILSDFRILSGKNLGGRSLHTPYRFYLLRHLRELQNKIRQSLHNMLTIKYEPISDASMGGPKTLSFINKYVVTPNVCGVCGSSKCIGEWARQNYELYQQLSKIFIQRFASLNYPFLNPYFETVNPKYQNIYSVFHGWRAKCQSERGAKRLRTDSGEDDEQTGGHSYNHRYRKYTSEYLRLKQKNHLLFNRK